MLQYRGIELRRFIWDLTLPWAKVDQQQCFEQRFQEPLLWEQDMPQHHGPSPEGTEQDYVQCGEELPQTFWMRCLSPRGTHASDAFCSLYLRARIERITKLYACFHPGCTARGYRSAKGAALMDAAAKACRRLYGARLSVQVSRLSVLTPTRAVLPSLLFSVPPAPATRPCACCCKELQLPATLSVSEPTTPPHTARH